VRYLQNSGCNLAMLFQQGIHCKTSIETTLMTTLGIGRLKYVVMTSRSVASTSGFGQNLFWNNIEKQCWEVERMLFLAQFYFNKRFVPAQRGWWNLSKMPSSVLGQRHKYVYVPCATSCCILLFYCWDEGFWQVLDDQTHTQCGICLWAVLASEEAKIDAPCFAKDERW